MFDKITVQFYLTATIGNCGCVWFCLMKNVDWWSGDLFQYLLIGTRCKRENTQEKIRCIVFVFIYDWNLFRFIPLNSWLKIINMKIMLTKQGWACIFWYEWYKCSVVWDVSVEDDVYKVLSYCFTLASCQVNPFNHVHHSSEIFILKVLNSCTKSTFAIDNAIKCLLSFYRLNSNNGNTCM